MKKLMTLIGAVATAFGLFAADPVVTGSASFESTREVGVDPTADTFTPASPWSWEGDPLTLGNYNNDAYTYVDATGNKRREFEGAPLQEKYLKLETTKSEVLSHAIAEGSIFVDQLVQFTGFEEAPAVDGAKIAVWMSEFVTQEEDETQQLLEQTETNLYITAGVDSTRSAKASVKIDGNYEIGKWYRLTIKSLGVIDDDATVGFIVYIDGQQVGSSDDAAKALIDSTVLSDANKALLAQGKLFPAMTTGAIEKVGYNGIGAIDDLTIDDQGPEFARKIPFTVATATGLEVDTIKDAAGNDVVPADGVANGTTVIVTYKAADGYKLMPGSGTTAQADITTTGVTINPGQDIVSAKVVATVTNDDGTTEYAASELETMIAGLVDGDVATFLDDATIGEDVFGTDTTITVADGAWTIAAVGELSLYSDIEKDIVITSEDDVYFASTIAADYTVDASAVTGLFMLDGEIEVEGTLKIGETFSAEGNTITLVGAGKVVSADGTLVTQELIVGADDAEIEVLPDTPSEGLYTYQIKAEEPKTGFAIIIAGDDETTTNYYETLDLAIDAAGTVDPKKGPLPAVVTLLDNATLTAPCDITKALTLDLNGFTLTGAADANWAIRMADVGPGVVIKNGTIAATKYGVRVEATGCTITGVTINSGMRAVQLTLGATVVVDGNSALTVNDTTRTKGEPGIFVTDASSLTIAAGSSLTANSNGGTITARDGGSAKSTVIVNGTVSNTFVPAVGEAYECFAISGNGTDGTYGVDITIGDGAVVSSASAPGIFYPCAGTLNIGAATITGTEAVYLKAGVTAIVSGATLTGNGPNKGYEGKAGTAETGDALVVANEAYPAGTANITVSGGTFTSANGAAVASYAKEGLEPVVGFISGGKFKGAADLDVALIALADGQDAAKWVLKDGFYEPFAFFAVAQVGDEKFESLAAAVAAAGADDTVTLLANTTLTETLQITKSTAINLAQKTVTFANDLAKCINAPEAESLAISNGTITVAEGRANIKGSRAIYLLHNTSVVFKDLTLNLPGFEYVLNKDCDLDPINDCWAKTPACTFDCDNVVINGNGSLFHFENAIATLKDCSTTASALESFGGAHAAAIYSSCGGETVIDGGTFTAPNALQTGNMGAVIVVKSGTFNGNIKSWMYEGDTRWPDNKASIVIQGGTFTGDFAYGTGQAGACTKDCLTWNITAGTFSVDPSAYLNDGYEAVKNGAVWTVQEESKTGFAIIIADGSDTNYYPTFDAAWAVAQEDDEIVLFADGTLGDPASTAKIELNKNLKLTLNGNELTVGGYYGRLYVVDGATLTVDGSVEGSQLNGTLYAGIMRKINKVKTFFDGNIVINGGTYVAGDDDTYGLAALQSNGGSANSSITATDATFVGGNMSVEPTAANRDAQGIAAVLAAKGAYTFTNCSFTGRTGIYAKAGTLTLDGCTVAANGTQFAPKANTDGSDPTGDAIIFDSNTSYKGNLKLDVKGNTTITSENGYAFQETVTKGSASATFEIAIADTATVNGSVVLSDAFAEKVAAGQASISGYVATADNIAYRTLAEAVAAVPAGTATTVTLLANTTLDTGVAIDKVVTLDLNGKTVTAQYATTKDAFVPPFNVLKDGNLTITGNGSIVGWTGAAAAALDTKPIIRVEGNLNFVNGTLTAGGVDDCGLYGVGIFNGGSATFGDTTQGPSIDSWFAAVAANNLHAPVSVTINNGSYTQRANGEGESWSYFCGAVYAAAQGEYEINGGTFDGALYSIVTRYNDVETDISINAGTFSDPMLVGEIASQATVKGERTVAKDAGVTLPVDADHYWFDGTTLGKKTDAVAKIGDDKLFLTLAKALSAAESGDTVTVLDDILTLQTEIIVGEGVTLDLNGKIVNADFHQTKLENGGTIVVYLNSATLLNNWYVGGTFVAGEVIAVENAYSIPVGTTMTVQKQSKVQTAIAIAVPDEKTLIWGAPIESNKLVTVSGGATIAAKIYPTATLTVADTLDPQPTLTTIEGFEVKSTAGEGTITYAAEIKQVKAIWIVDGVATTNEVVYNTVPEKPADPEKANYTFTGWDKDTTVAIKVDTEYTAQFEAITYKYTFAKGGAAGEATVADITYTVETTATLTAPAAGTDWTVADSEFAGWTNTVEGGEIILTGAELAKALKDIELTAVWVAKAPVIPVDDDDKLDDNGKAAAAKTLEVFGDAAAVTTWANAVYTDGKIPAEKLNKTTEDLIKIAKEYELPIMVAPTVEIKQAAEGTGFEFQIIDEKVPVALQAEKVLSMVEFTTAIGDATKPFATAEAKDVSVAIKTDSDNKTATADFTKATAAGFMRVNLKTDK